MPGSVEFRAHGLDELHDALTALPGDLRREADTAGVEAAGDVADAARGNAVALGGVAAKSAPSLNAERGIDGGLVTLGGEAYPFAAGAEFGATRYPQFEPYRGPEGGYFLYPAIREKGDEIDQVFLDAADRALQQNGL